MDDKTKTEFTKEVIDNGKTVTVITRVIKCDFDEMLQLGFVELKDIPKDPLKEALGCELWELSIEGKTGEFTTWSEWFLTSKLAMEAGMAAILNEGIDEFYNKPCFGVA